MIRLCFMSGTWYGKKIDSELDVETTRGACEVEDMLLLAREGTPVMLVGELDDAEDLIDIDEVEMA